MKKLNVLVACEYSGTVRDAFIKLGHSATSCDLLPSDRPGPHHHGNVLDIIHRGFDLLIGHPPCTFNANSSVQHLSSQKPKPGWNWVSKYERFINPERWHQMLEMTAFFKALLNAPIEKRGIENPIPHHFAVEYIGRNFDQTIQPWMFGHTQKKATCLWLEGLPPLVETNNVLAQTNALPMKEQQKIFYCSPGPNRWKMRSTTFQGIADAMAMQWGGKVSTALFFPDTKAA
jgi:hypothetical protein